MCRLFLMILTALLFFQNSFGQTISSQKGLTTIVFTTTYAIVTVYLPDDLQNGDKISGTFTVFNEGFSDAQMEKSLEEVRQYKFNFSNPENQTSILQKMVSINPNQLVGLLPLKITSSLILTLTESTGKIYKAVIKPSMAPSVTVDDCLSPEHFLLDKPFRITGTFDGNAANTRVTIGDVPIPILAESPRQCIVQIPEKMKITDTMELKVLENLQLKCKQPVIPVKMIVGAEKISVKKGETTTVYLTIKGLKGMEAPSHLTVENKTPKIITLKDGNKQGIEIIQGMFKGSSDLNMNFTVQGITSGTFELDFNLEIPEDFPPEIER
ncbi:MAG TPA: hypothetical protein PLS10_07890 [Chitinophagales bacterium]|nr:hypothetical protein [Chitinophagales bacterium]